ncbi:MAG TPA: MotA/TolQ/ExbB proton channel family protein [Lachnospiraceae bacterium]|nr:MotA/TolQ/ExbB proton channel family protein [Lachnospiraceae bacterium]
MLSICDFLANNLNVIIVVFAIAEGVLMCVSGYILFVFRLRIDKLNKTQIFMSRHSKKAGKGKVMSTYESFSQKNWNEYDQFLTDYQKKGIIYSAFSMCIQLFTLLGILGTVAGLYISMNADQNIYEGVEFALSSTVLGIIFAVFYKFCDILFVSIFINYIEDGILRFEKNYHIDSEAAGDQAEPDRKDE